MTGWKLRLLLVVVAGASLSVWTVALAADYESPQSRNRKPASGWAKKDKTSVDLDAVIQEKLQRILANQQLILQKAEAVKGELGIIKVRASSSLKSVTFLSSGAPCP